MLNHIYTVYNYDTIVSSLLLCNMVVSGWLSGNKNGSGQRNIKNPYPTCKPHHNTAHHNTQRTAAQRTATQRPAPQRNTGHCNRAPRSAAQGSAAHRTKSNRAYNGMIALHIIYKLQSSLKLNTNIFSKPFPCDC